jgi:hypothetical protein
MADDSRILITPEFRMSYPNLITPKQFQNKGEPTYSMEMIFEPEDLGRFKLLDDPSGKFVDVDVQQMCLAVIKGKWGEIDVKSEFARSWPVKSGDTLAENRKSKGKKALDAYLGKKVIRCKASANYPPRLYFQEDGERKEIVRGSDTSTTKGKQLFVGGFYAFAELTVKALDTAQGKFVTFYVNSVKLTREGERFGGPSMMDRFDQSGVSGGQTAHDPTAGMTDDDIPF